jgi:hypothetical protein
VLYNRGVKWLAVAIAALFLSACSKNIDNQEAAQKAVDEYFGQPKLRTMTARVQSVIFRGNEADVTLMVSARGSDPSQAIPMPYVLEKKSSGWAVKGPAAGGMAGHAGQASGQMPAGHPGMGGAGPNGASAPGASPDGSQKLNLPPDHPPIGGTPK